jgi:nucleoside-diphosphate-sugar epimerase
VKILVTGATGRVGSNLIRDLARTGHSCRAFVIPGDPQVKKLDGLNCEIAPGDLLDEQTIRRATRGVDAVIHLAALMNKPSGMSEAAFWNMNVFGTFVSVRAAAEEGVARYLYGSSDASYSALNYRYLPIDERHPQRPDYLYGLTKLVGEDIVFEAWRETGLPVTVLRYGSVVAGQEILDKFTVGGVMGALKTRATKPGTYFYVEGVKAPWEPLEKYMNDPECKIIPRGPDWRSWRTHMTDVRDVVAGTIKALESDRAVGEAFNILGPCAFTYEQAVKYLAEKTGIRYVECVLHNYFDFEISIRKAKTTLGYAPEYDIYRMIDSALEARSGTDIDVIPPMLGYGFEAYDPYGKS